MEEVWRVGVDRGGVEDHTPVHCFKETLHNGDGAHGRPNLPQRRAKVLRQYRVCTFKFKLRTRVCPNDNTCVNFKAHFDLNHHLDFTFKLFNLAPEIKKQANHQASLHLS